ncbi:MAG: hypothetical protein MR625_02900 [Clostridium sp.]|nr:hypothetical protein [Clostridium sp.]MDD7282538.1 hypothetical protein [Clostridium sp.]
MEKMIVTQALDERDLLKKKIRDAIAKCDFVAVQKPGDDVIAQDKQKVADYEAEVKASFQSIRDMMDRYTRLDAAILLANATTKIEVAGKTMTRAAAINLRKMMKGQGLADTDFTDAMIRKMTTDLDRARLKIAKSQEVADRQREVMSNSLVSSDKKVLSEDNLKSITAYCDNLVLKLVDPIDIEKTIADMQEKWDNLTTNLESAIRISNATTYVEF